MAEIQSLYSIVRDFVGNLVISMSLANEEKKIFQMQNP